MTSIIIFIKSRLYILSVLLLLTTIISCGSPKKISNKSDLNTDNLKQYTVSFKSQDVIVESTSVFAWYPESKKIYEDPNLKDLPLTKEIKEAISQMLWSKGISNVQYHEIATNFNNRRTNNESLLPKDLISVKEWKWEGANFGATGLLKKLVLENNSSWNYRDIKVRIDYLGTMGGKEGTAGPTATFTINKKIPAKSERTFTKINVGFRHPDSKKERIRVMNATKTIDQFLVGFILVQERILDDEEIDRVYGLSINTGGNNDIIINYEPGTLIVDIIHPSTGGLIWRGFQETYIKTTDDSTGISEKIDIAVGKLVDKFLET
ncbi:MAG: DUF4136 domain-containing protein [Thermodesulfobacteriota bacterium]